MTNLSREEQIELMAFINMMSKKLTNEEIKDRISKIYSKLEKEIFKNGR